MPSILALDEGTTSVRAILFDESGALCGTAQRPLELSYPKLGWVEVDAAELWRAQLAVAEEAAQGRSDIAAVSITNQRETTILWDRASGEPVAPAIVWQDRRTAPECDKLREAGDEDLIRERTGLLIDPYFSATKLAWLLENTRGARKRAEAGELAAGTIESWLVFKLTAGRVHITDASNASRTLLLNLRTGEWDEDLVRLFNIPRGVLPEVRGTSEVIGEVSCGSLLDGTSIAGLAGDQQAALFGQLCLTPGMTKCTYGTGAFILQAIGTTPTLSRHRLLTTIARKEGKAVHYALEGSAFVAGAVVQWLRDGLGIIKSSGEVEALAKQVPDSGGVVLVPAFVGLGAPYWDPYARGLIVGLTRDTTAAHIARAALEAIAHQVADLAGALVADSGKPLPELRVDGGAVQNDTLLQFQADMLQVPVVRPTITEVTALGAAYLGGLATGVWKSSTELERHWKIDRTFEPRMPNARAAELRQTWKQAVARSRNWAAPGGAALPSDGPS
jgi:glycerol kinase